MAQSHEVGKDLSNRFRAKTYNFFAMATVLVTVSYVLTSLFIPKQYILSFDIRELISYDFPIFMEYMVGVVGSIAIVYLYFLYDGIFKKPINAACKMLPIKGVGRLHDISERIVYQEPTSTDELKRAKKLVLFSKHYDTPITKLFDFEEGNHTTARIINYFRSNRDYMDLFKIIEGYLNDNQYDSLYDGSFTEYRAFDNGKVCFAPKLIKEQLNRITKDFKRYLERSLDRPTRLRHNKKILSSKHRNKMVDIFAFITFHRLIGNFSNIPTGLVESKVKDYDMRLIVNTYPKEGFTIDIGTDNNGTNPSFNDDTFASVFLSLYHHYMQQGSSNLDVQQILKIFDPIGDVDDSCDDETVFTFDDAAYKPISTDRG